MEISDRINETDYDSLNLHPLLSIPFYLYHSYLEKQDLINLSTLNKQYRNEMSPIVFNKIKLTWSNMIDSIKKKNTFFIKYKYTISQLRITNPDSYGEWQIDIFNDLLSYLPNLTNLIINTQSSTNWLKYRYDDNITLLDLYKQDLLVYNNLPLFSIEHLKNFKMLKVLKLYQYNLNWSLNDGNDNGYPVLMINQLHLTDCTWEYPFKLSQFNYNSNLKKLDIEYKYNHFFLKSERFNKFINIQEEDTNDKFNLKSLEHIKFKINADEEGNEGVHLGCPVFMNWCRKTNFPQLLTLEFACWDVTTKDLTDYSKFIPETNAKELIISLRKFKEFGNLGGQIRVKKILQNPNMELSYLDFVIR